jgi:hypothetical protein
MTLRDPLPRDKWPNDSEYLEMKGLYFMLQYRDHHGYDGKFFRRHAFDTAGPADILEYCIEKRNSINCVRIYSLDNRACFKYEMFTFHAASGATPPCAPFGHQGHASVAIVRALVAATGPTKMYDLVLEASRAMLNDDRKGTGIGPRRIVDGTAARYEKWCGDTLKGMQDPQCADRPALLTVTHEQKAGDFGITTYFELLKPTNIPAPATAKTRKVS